MALYVGIAFPFQVGPTGFPAPASDNDLIKQALIQLILTGRGERVMRPAYGSGAFSFVFESNEAPLTAYIAQEVRNVIGKFEPRVILQNVDVVKNDSSGLHPSLVVITINYVVIVTGQTQQVTITIGGP